MNPKAESKLAQRLAAIEARLAAIEGRQNPAPQPAPSLGFGPAKDNQGNVLPLPGAVPYEQRMKERATNETRHAEQAWRDMTDGLPAGIFRDGCGILRRISGGERIVGPEIQEIERNLKHDK